MVETFVGRGAEMGRLRARLEDLVAGRGGVVTLSGEAGIGKTRMAQEVAALAAESGAQVFAGQCLEGHWSPPYRPWTTALTACVRATDARFLRGILGPGAAA